MSRFRVVVFGAAAIAIASASACSGVDRPAGEVAASQSHLATAGHGRCRRPDTQHAARLGLGDPSLSWSRSAVLR